MMPGMDVIYYDPAPKMPPHGRAKLVSSMEEVLADSDIVTLHVPGIPTTQKMINEQTLALMKPGSYLINTARGEVVDYEAVAEAIESGRLAGIAADVFEDEPAKRGDSFNHVLRGVGRAILTPHIAGSTVEAQREIGSSVAIKLLGYLSSGNSIGSVNLPELALGDVPTGVRRLLHIHNNVPGVMANVTTVLAESGLNIVGSNQRANEKVAYAAFDIEGEISDDTVQAIRELPETYRLRAL
jgi:D-3-phosphoglycerate dehydrogenase